MTADVPMTHAPLILDEAALAPLIDMNEAIACLEEAFRRRKHADIANIPRSRAHLPGGVLNLMAAVDGPAGFFGSKSYFASPRGVSFHFALHDLESGRLLAFMTSSKMSQVRTGAASGLAIKYMAKPDASVLALIGTGRQAMAQALAARAVRPIREIRVFGRDAERRNAFADRLARELDVAVVPTESARAAVEGAAVVSTITRAYEPVLDAAWLAPGTFVNAAGANASDRREIDAETIRRCTLLVTDDIQQARIEAAEFIDLDRAGAFDWASVVELAEVVSGVVPVRRAPGDVTLFKSLGIAFEDVAFGAHLYRKALAAGAVA